MGDKAGKLAEKAEKSLAETYAAMEDAIDRTKEKTGKKLDKIIPAYDSGKPDTENNRNRFYDHLKVKPGKDVNGIYSFGDYMGIDYKVMLAFEADQSTIDSIVSRKSLNLSSEVHIESLLAGYEFPWWDKKRIGKIKPYKKMDELEYYEYLWYDKKTKKAWYVEYSM